MNTAHRLWTHRYFQLAHNLLINLRGLSEHWLRGRGDRICIGIAFAKLEMKIIATHLLRNYQWEILPSQNLDPFPIPTLRPKDGLKVRFRSIRKGNS